MNFIKVKATGRPVNGTEKDNFEKTFYINSSLIKLITEEGQVFLFDNGCDSRDNFLWNEHEKFFDIRIFDIAEFESKLSYFDSEAIHH
ncbi:MAG: hypothetical protein R2757_09535 [Draconibacterium sp.]